MNKILILFSILALFCSCVKKADESMHILSVKLGNAADYVNLSDVVSQSECIPLETSDSVIVDDIVRIVSKENEIYVADRLSIYKYDSTGKFQSKFDKHGIAPDEYIHISDFFIGKNGELWILSRSGQCLYNYAWDGTLSEVIQLDCWATRMCPVDEEHVLIYVGNEKDKNNDYQLGLLSLNTKKIADRYLPIDDKRSRYLHVVGHNYFSPTNENGEIYFSQMFSDTIYQVGVDKLTPVYYVNLGNNNIPNSFFDNEYQNIMDFFQHLSPKGYAYGINWLWGNDKVFWLSYYYQGECYLSILSANGSTRSAYELRDDLSLFGYPIKFEGLGVFPQSCNELILAVSPVDIIEYGKANLDLQEQKLLQQQIHYVGDDQNMVLLRLKL